MGDWSAQVKTLEISVEAHFSMPVSWSQLMRVERLPWTIWDSGGLDRSCLCQKRIPSLSPMLRKSTGAAERKTSWPDPDQTTLSAGHGMIGWR